MLNPIKKKRNYSREYMYKGLSVNQRCIQDRRILKIINDQGRCFVFFSKWCRI